MRCDKEHPLSNQVELTEAGAGGIKNSFFRSEILVFFQDLHKANKRLHGTHGYTEYSPVSLALSISQ